MSFKSKRVSALGCISANMIIRPFQNLHVDNFEDCGECKYKYLCGGGCRGRSYLRYGNINQKDAYCAMIFNYYKDLMIEVKKNLGGIS